MLQQDERSIINRNLNTEVVPMAQRRKFSSVMRTDFWTQVLEGKIIMEDQDHGQETTHIQSSIQSGYSDGAIDRHEKSISNMPGAKYHR